MAMLWRSFFVSCLLLSLSLSAGAQVRCAISLNDRPDVNQTLGSFRSMPPMWTTTMPKLLQRYWNHPEVLAIETAFLNTSEGRHSRTKVGSLTIEWVLKRKISSVIIEIPLIKVDDLVPGTRPESMSMDFMKLLAGTMRALKSMQENDPEIRHAHLFPAMVVNTTLVSMLTKLGFERINQDLSIYYLALDFGRTTPEFATTDIH